MAWLEINLNEIASNSVVGLVAGAFTWVGTRVGRFITRVNKTEKDLNALWPRFRELESIVKGDGNACRDGAQATDEMSDRKTPGEGHDRLRLGGRKAD
jgi:hypothetical protein